MVLDVAVDDEVQRLLGEAVVLGQHPVDFIQDGLGRGAANHSSQWWGMLPAVVPYLGSKCSSMLGQSEAVISIQPTVVSYLGSKCSGTQRR